MKLLISPFLKRKLYPETQMHYFTDRNKKSSYTFLRDQINSTSMQQTYQIKNGEISFNHEEIIIIDNAPQEFRNRVISSFFCAIYGFFSIWKFLHSNNHLILWTGLLIGVGNLIVLISFLFRTTRNQIKMEEVKSMELKQRFGYTILDIKLTNYKTRRVSQIDIVNHELNAFIAANFKAS